MLIIMAQLCSTERRRDHHTKTNIIVNPKNIPVVFNESQSLRKMNGITTFKEPINRYYWSNWIVRQSKLNDLLQGCSNSITGQGKDIKMCDINVIVNYSFTYLLRWMCTPNCNIDNRYTRNEI